MPTIVGIPDWEKTGKTAGTGGISHIERRGSPDPQERNIFIIVGRLLDSIKRKNFQNRSGHFHQAGELGLTGDWELAHIWGPGFGDEAAAGIMWAPERVNQDFQNRGVEKWLRGLQAIHGPGVVEITATAASWDNDFLARHYQWSGFRGAEFLKRIEYEVTGPAGLNDSDTGLPLRGMRIGLTLDPPRPNTPTPRVHAYVQTSGGAAHPRPLRL